MRQYLKKCLTNNNNFVKDSIIIFAGSMFANIFNYLYQMFVARVLGPEDYGIFGSLFALIYIVIMGAGILNIVIIKYTAQYHAKNELGKIRSIFTRFSAMLFVTGLAALLLYILISPYIAKFMKIDSVFLLSLVGIYGFVSLFMPIYDGIITGLQRFKLKSYLMPATPMLKILFFFLFVYFGYALSGAFLAIIIAQILSTILFIIPNLSLLKYKSENIEKKDVMKYAVPVFIGTVVPPILINIDIVLVKHFFTSAEAGFYAAASMLGKVIFFAASVLVIALFPKITQLHTNGKKTNALLKAGLFYTFIITLFGILVYFIAPTFVVRLLYGSEYKIENLIGLFAIAIAFFSLNNILINYNLAKNRFGFGYFIIFIGLVEIVSIIFWHNSLVEIVKILIFSFALLFVCLMFYNSRSLGIKLPFCSSMGGEK